jgi:hypothetical protein
VSECRQWESDSRRTTQKKSGIRTRHAIVRAAQDSFAATRTGTDKTGIAEEISVMLTDVAGLEHTFPLLSAKSYSGCSWTIA